MVSATLSGTCPTTPGQGPSPRILFRIDAVSDAQSIRKCLSALVPHPTRLLESSTTLFRSPASHYLQKQLIAGAKPVFHIRRWNGKRRPIHLAWLIFQGGHETDLNRRRTFVMTRIGAVDHLQQANSKAKLKSFRDDSLFAYLLQHLTYATCSNS